MKGKENVIHVYIHRALFDSKRKCNRKSIKIHIFAMFRSRCDALSNMERLKVKKKGCDLLRVGEHLYSPVL
jgi:hypothetical protein